MSWQLLWEPPALNAAVARLKKDPGGVAALLQATDQLAREPRPQESRPWAIDHRRLRHGPWRILYRLDTNAQTVHIERIGHTGG